MNRTDLSSFRNDDYRPGPVVKRVAWYLVSLVFFQSYLFPFSGPKAILLRLFGARVGKGLVIKPSVRIKYPWFLDIGDHVWIGEGVWIDNLVQVRIGSHVCISQEAMLLTGNHDYKRSTFDLTAAPITLERGVWAGARSLLLPGAVCENHAVISAGAVFSGRAEAYGIYRGNPAVKVKTRVIE